MGTFGDFPGVPWLRLCTSNVGVEGLNPGQGTKVPHAVWTKKKKEFISIY